MGNMLRTGYSSVLQHGKTSSLPIVWDEATYINAGLPDTWEHQARFGYRVLGIAEQTAVRHTYNAAQKLGCVNKLQAVVKALRLELIRWSCWLAQPCS